MKVINRESGKHGLGEYKNRYVTYTFDTGHTYTVWHTGGYFGYTKTGNYASQPTLHKLIRLASEYEDRRVQVPD